jgi:hypothetical protein
VYRLLYSLYNLCSASPTGPIEGILLFLSICVCPRTSHYRFSDRSGERDGGTGWMRPVLPCSPLAPRINTVEGFSTISESFKCPTRPCAKLKNWHPTTSNVINNRVILLRFVGELREVRSLVLVVRSNKETRPWTFKAFSGHLQKVLRQSSINCKLKSINCKLKKCRLGYRYATHTRYTVH